MIVCAVTVFGWTQGNMHELTMIVHKDVSTERTHPIISAIFDEMRKRMAFDGQYEREGLHVAVRWDSEVTIQNKPKVDKDGQADQRDKAPSRKRTRKATKA